MAWEGGKQEKSVFLPTSLCSVSEQFKKLFYCMEVVMEQTQEQKTVHLVSRLLDEMEGLSALIELLGHRDNSLSADGCCGLATILRRIYFSMDEILDEMKPDWLK